LTDLIDTGQPAAILDVRWRLDEPDGRASYLQGHLPGAVYVSLEDELSDHSVTGRGRHPLPSGRSVEAAARRWGVRQGVPTVVYDDWNRAGSARAWWVLRWAGLSRVSILEGGLQAWTATGHPLSTDEPEVAPGDVELGSGGMPELDADAAAALAARGLLVDARDAAAYRDGHIPGARNVPSQGVLSADGTLGDRDEVRAQYGVITAGAPVPGLSCGGGVAGAFAVAALAHTGVTAPLYVGSFSAWSADPDRSVATGAEPGTTEESL